MRRARLSLGFLASFAWACGSTSPAPESPTTAEPAAPPPEPAAPEPPATEEKPSEAPVEIDQAPPPASKANVFDLDDWANEHQIQIDLKADGCEPAELGEKPKEVIWCSHHVDSTHVSLATRALYAVRGKKLVKLVELAVSMTPLATGKPSVKLELVKSDDKNVELREAEGAGCDHAKQENDDAAITKPEETKERRAATAKVCAARGRYQWAGGNLRKAR
jgi:hypothetical protein